MTENEKFDLIVIGAGPGGYTAAKEAGKCGLSVALIEKGEPGGTCLNRGCIPTKALLHAAKILSEEKKHPEWRTGGPEEHPAPEPSFRFGAVAAYRDETVAALRNGLVQSFKACHVTLLPGEGKIRSVSEDGVEVVLDGTRTLRAGDVILAAGSRAAKIPVPGAEAENVITSDEMLAMKEIPRSVVIVGGGVIGCEFACFLNRFGTDVTIVEALPRILNNFDREISQSLKMIFRKRGISILTDRKVLSMDRNENGTLTCRYRENREGAGEESASAAYILISAGRKTDPSGLLCPDFPADRMPLRTEKGRIPVDGSFRTSLPHVYAVGDIIPGIQLAHAAEAAGKRTARFLAAARGKAVPEDTCDLPLVPSCIYTDPEISSVGLTEEEAKAAGIDVRTGKAVMGANAKSVITGEERGFMKFVAEAGSGRILGAQFLCARASDLIGEAALAVANGLTVRDCLKPMRAHPTYEEAMTDALEDLLRQK